jgi:hypothetical protein
LKLQGKASSRSMKKKVDKFMETLKRALNCMVEYIDEDADEEDIRELGDGIKGFLESATDKKHFIFIDQLLENLQSKIDQNFHHKKKIRMAIMNRFLHLVLFCRTNYQAKFEVDCGSLLFTFYFETYLGCKKFLEDFRKGVIQQELCAVVQYEPFLWIFKLKKGDVMVDVEEHIVDGECWNG